MNDTAARLGDEWDTLTPQQRDTLTRLDEGLCTRKPVLSPNMRTEALHAVVQMWRGDITLEAAGEAVEAAKWEKERAYAVARALGVATLEETGQQSDTARTLSVDRQALLKWAGLRS